MENPQERLTLSKEFVAGLIVGEGYFGLSVNKSPRIRTKWGFSIRPAFSMQMNDLETMKAVLAAFKEWELPAYVSEPKGKSLRIDVVGHRRVLKIIEFFGPLLTGDKKRSASIVQEFIELRFSKSQSSPYGDDELELVARLRQVNAQRGNAITAAELKQLHDVKRYNRDRCSNGHTLKDNVYIDVDSDGYTHKRCKICSKDRTKRRRERLKTE